VSDVSLPFNIIIDQNFDFFFCFFMEVLEEEKLAENAAKMGEILRSEISSFNPEIVIDVRGKGLFTGVTIKEMKGL
jgi:4-aminobutyrate aminotransferase-like enzyme